MDIKRKTNSEKRFSKDMVKKKPTPKVIETGLRS
jgi:hypothetical protein